MKIHVSPQFFTNKSFFPLKMSQFIKDYFLKADFLSSHASETFCLNLSLVPKMKS